LRHDQGDHRNRRFNRPRDDRRTGNPREPRHANLEIDRRSVHEGYSDITRKVKIDVPSIDRKIDATTFSDWIVAIEDYFDWYEMSDIEQVRFAKMKLIGPARKFWQTVTSHLDRMCQPPIIQWEVMKDRLKEKYLPFFHKTHLVDQMLDLRQSTSSVSDYINSFEELTQRCNLLEDASFTIARFIRGLQTDLKREVSLSTPYTLDEAYYKTLEVEKLDKLYRVRRAAPRSRAPAQSVHKMNEFAVNASMSKGHNP